MFVQSEKYVEAHGGKVGHALACPEVGHALACPKPGDIAVYG
jgi:hypothetical protein